MLGTFDIPRDARAPLVARDTLDHLASDLELTSLEDARLLLTELVTNSVRHGAGDTIRVIFDRPAVELLRCEVVDDGDGFTPVAREPDPKRIGGWGLHLVEQVAADWGVRQGSTHVWFELPVRVAG